MDIKYPVVCPLMDNEKIEEEICFDIHSVVDAGAPKYTAPDLAMEKKNFKEICRTCPFHRYD